MRRSKKLWIVAAGSAVAIGLAGCSATVSLNGEKVGNADEFINEADQAFNNNLAHAPADSMTKSDDSRCFYEKANEDEISPVVQCGPVKLLGHEGNWLAISYETKIDASGKQILSNPLMAKTASSSTGELFRPDGKKPAEVDTLAAPLGPRTSEKDFAVLVPLENLRTPVNFDEEIEPQSVLKAPAGNLSITHRSSDQLIPGEVLAKVTTSSSESPSGEGNLEFYRPAESQTLFMYKVSLSSPEASAPKLDSTWSKPEGTKNATLSLSVSSGSQHLGVLGGFANGSSFESAGDSATANLQCDSVPCPNLGGKEYLLVVSSAEKEAPTLVGTTDGESQGVNLGTGDLDSGVSTVAYDRDRLEQQVSAAWGTKTAELVSKKEAGKYSDATKLTYGGQVSSVYLAPFEATNGWAPKGKAWLIAQVDDMVREDEPYNSKVTVDWSKSWSLKSGDETFRAQPEQVEDRAVFEVPADLKKGTMTFQPTGVATYRRTDSDYQVSKKQKSFTVEEALSLEVEIP